MAQIRIILYLMLAYDVFAILQHKEWYCRIADDKNQICPTDLIFVIENAKMMLVKPTARMIVRKNTAD